jgi:hypothetical protein
VTLEHLGDFPHGIDLRSIRPLAPIAKELRCPYRGTVGPELIEVFSHQVSLRRLQIVLVQREMDFCLIGVNRKWVTVTNLF